MTMALETNLTSNHECIFVSLCFVHVFQVSWCTGKEEEGRRIQGRLFGGKDNVGRKRGD